jgi:hypothetical protein
MVQLCGECEPTVAGRSGDPGARISADDLIRTYNSYSVVVGIGDVEVAQAIARYPLRVIELRVLCRATVACVCRRTAHNHALRAVTK